MFSQTFSSILTRLSKCEKSIFFSGVHYALAICTIVLLVRPHHPSTAQVVIALLSVVLLRQCGMVWNRYLDRSFDQRNPRTKNRSAVSLATVLSLSVLWWLWLWMLGDWFFTGGVLFCLVVFYSLTKRFTYSCHLWLGLLHGLLPPLFSLYLTQTVDPFFPIGVSHGLMIALHDVRYAWVDRTFDKREHLYNAAQLFSERGLFILSVAVISLSFFLHASVLCRYSYLGMIFPVSTHGYVLHRYADKEVGQAALALNSYLLYGWVTGWIVWRIFGV